MVRQGRKCGVDATFDKLSATWPVYFDSCDRVVFRPDSNPNYMVRSVLERFERWVVAALPGDDVAVACSTLSWLETAVLRLLLVLDKNLKPQQSTCSNSALSLLPAFDIWAVVDLVLQWNLPKLLVGAVLDHVRAARDLGEPKNDVRKVYVEMCEVDPKRIGYDSKQLGAQLEGLD